MAPASAVRPVLCLRYPARVCLQCARPERLTEQRTERILDVVQTLAIPEIRVRAVLPDRLVDRTVKLAGPPLSDQNSRKQSGSTPGGKSGLLAKSSTVTVIQFSEWAAGVALR